MMNPDDESLLQEALGHVRRAVKLARDQEKPYLFLGRLWLQTEGLIVVAAAHRSTHSVSTVARMGNGSSTSSNSSRAARTERA